jgi:hypothetical protein
VDIDPIIDGFEHTVGYDPPVCTENSVRIDYVTESPNVSGDDCSVLSAISAHWTERAD